MDINLSNCVKISPNSRIKLVNDFFPEFEECIEECDYNDQHLSIHAGALCLYAATLLTKIYDKSPDHIDDELDEIDLESNEREIAIQDAIKSLPKFSGYTEAQIQGEAHKIILKDIRNCFAHGNFKISYNVYTKKLNFVLFPQRKDIDIDIPIVISKHQLQKALAKSLSRTALKYQILTVAQQKDMINNNLNSALQSLMLPMQLFKIAEYYLEKNTQKLTVDKKRFALIQYALLLSQITYEQDDYYNIFGKNSNMFKKIATIRNANAHSNLIFGELAKRITYIDRTKSLDESLQSSISALLIAQNLKESILSLIKTGANSEGIEDLKGRLLQSFDFLFNGEGMPDLSIPQK